MEERSRKRLWEDYVFHFLQKIPPDHPDPVARVSSLADAMLEAHDLRWNLHKAISEGRATLSLKRPQGGKAIG
jgi:hypothetical protein